jgi:hypothetical protein
MADKKPHHTFTTPRGTFVWPKLNKPDTKWKAEGEYSVKHRVQPEQITDALREKLEAVRDEFVETTKEGLKGAKLKTLKVLDIPFNAELDRETGEETGAIIIHAKMTASGVSKKDKKPWARAPKLFDAKGTKLRAGVQIWGGSEGKLAVDAVPYYNAKDNAVGISFRLEAVQVLKLISGSDKDAGGYGFGEEEGYTDEQEETFPSDEANDGEPAGDAPAPSDDF